MGAVAAHTRQKISEEIRRLHGLGWNDRMISDEIGLAVCTIIGYRKRLDLAANYTITPGTVRSDNKIHPHRDRIVELYSLNWDDSAIARELGLSRRELSYYRHKHLKLPTIARKSAVHRHLGRRKQEQTLGMGPQDVRATRYWSIAPQLGWPDGLRFRAVQILEYLLTQPDGATSAMIVEALQITPARLSSNDPEGTYLANMISRGLVAAASKSMVTGRVDQRWKAPTRGSLYFATPAAFEAKAAWRLQHSSEEEQRLLSDLAEYGRRARRGRHSSTTGPMTNDQ